MPRDGSGQYGLPFPDVVEGTTIESAVYNGFTNDVAQDLNAPRPIVAGGTGANNALDAMINLKGEVSLQVVTNYDDHPFVSGSFYSSSSATGAPVGHSLAGICYTDNAGNIVIEARDYILPNAPLYVRTKVVGVWGAWQEQISSTADADARYVNLSGDIMTGDLWVSSATAHARIAVNSAPGTPSVVSGHKNNALRWEMYLGNAEAESGSNTGSDFQLLRVDDAGSASLGDALVISRATGAANFGGDITAGSGGTVGSYLFGNSGTKYLTFDGTNFRFYGGSVAVHEPYFYVGAAGTSGVVNFGNAGKNLAFDGTNFSFNGAPLISTGRFYADGGITTPAGQTNAFNGPSAFNAALATNAGVTANSTLNVMQPPGSLAQGTGGSFMLQSAGGGNEAFITFHNAGAYAVNFGLAADNNRLWTGGWSMGAGNRYQILDTRDSVVVGGRLVYAGDYQHGTNGDANIWPGSVVTSLFVSTVNYARHRWQQVLINGTWYTVGIAG